MEEIKPKDNWILQKIEIEFQQWGEDKGKYVGRIAFQNGDNESFVFKIRPEMAKPYIELMSKDIIKCAETLGERLTKSLGIK